MRRAVTRGRGSWAALAVMAVAALVPGPPEAHLSATPAAASTPAQTEPGLVFEHHLTYDVDPSAVVVRVRHEVTLTNDQPDEPVAGGIRYTYFPEVGIPVATGAANLHATKADGTAVSSALETSESPLVSFAVVDLSPDLRYGDTQQLVITYDLPPVPPRSESAVRVNPAFVGFPVLLDGDPGRTSVEVRVPEPFTVEVVGDEMEQRSEGGLTILRAEPADPAGFLTSVVARNDDALLSREVDLGEHDVTVQGWPDDPEWADFTEVQVRDGVPVLERLIGLRWPATDALDVLETAAPYLYGYAGWYQPLEHVIEVGDELDQAVILHELAHLWFNADLFAQRWISEGLAEVFATAAVAELGGAPREPEQVDPTALGAVRLNEWAPPDLESDIAQEQEAYGYNAAWTVLDQIVAEIGLAALAEVVVAADAGEVAYPGPGYAEVGGTFRWTHLLDLLEERAGSQTARPLFEQHVVAEDELPRLADRDAARARYDELEIRGGTWTPPAEVREDLTTWRFSEAREALDAAGSILDTRDQIIAALGGLDAEPAALEAAYEASRDLDEVSAQAEAALASAEAIQAGAAAADRSVGPLGAVGLLLSSPDDRMDEALAAFTAGDYELAAARARSTVDLVDGATRAGAVRLVAALALISVLGAALGVRRRRAGVRDPAR